MLPILIFQRTFVARRATNRSLLECRTGWPPETDARNRRPAVCKASADETARGLAAVLAPEFVFDLAIDALKLPWEIRDHQFQRIFASVDDAPKLGALCGA